MSFRDITISEKLVPANYLKNAQDAQKSKLTATRELLEKRKLPAKGWTDTQIEQFVQELAALDSNNFEHNIGLGEREARIACKLVARRHYNFGHGIGRSGDLNESQPKAAGSTLLAKLTNALLLELIHECGVRSCCDCLLIPMATGMTLTLCLLALKKQRPQAKYVIWSRIDQKSCFKSITTAGLTPIIVDTKCDVREQVLTTNLKAFETVINELPADEILCLFSTTSCFAPRNCDNIIGLAELAAQYELPHLVNNAYGLQSTLLTHQLEQAQRIGRVDLFVQSTDKNLMVPVGGAIVATFDKKLLELVATTYAGRASSTQTLDVFMTLLSLGKSGLNDLYRERKQIFEYLRERLIRFAAEHNERVPNTKLNPISLAMSLSTLAALLKEDNGKQYNIEEFGAMLYTRGVSGVRVVPIGVTKTIDNHLFKNWSTHCDLYNTPYLTVAAAVGIRRFDIDNFFLKLEECWLQFIQRLKK